MEHVLFVQKVKKDKKEEYIKYHKECWQDLLKEMKNSGIKREIIWMNGEQIMVYIMAKDFNDSMDKLAKTDVFKKWTELMTPLLANIQDYSSKGKVLRLEEIFNLERLLKNN